MFEPIFLVGPTCSGKSKVAISLAKYINAEIVSCDSMQVYCKMDIATDKPTREQRKLIPHHIIDIVGIDKQYDVFQYKETAEKIINNIQNKNKIPLIVGGTGLYVKALIDGLFIGPSGNERIRNNLEKRVNKDGLSCLYKELKEIDPIASSKININDKRRIIRALEVYHTTGKPISSFQNQWNKKNNSIIIGLNREKQDLYNRIDKRIDWMFENGLIEETKELIKLGIMKNKTAWQALGYKEVKEYIYGKCSLDCVKDLLKCNTHMFAKRQLTWFKKDDRVKWFLIKEHEKIEDIQEKIIDYLKGVYPHTNS